MPRHSGTSEDLASQAGRRPGDNWSSCGALAGELRRREYATVSYWCARIGSAHRWLMVPISLCQALQIGAAHLLPLGTADLSSSALPGDPLGRDFRTYLTRSVQNRAVWTRLSPAISHRSCCLLRSPRVRASRFTEWDSWLGQSDPGSVSLIPTRQIWCRLACRPPGGAGSPGRPGAVLPGAPASDDHGMASRCR